MLLSCNAHEWMCGGVHACVCVSGVSQAVRMRSTTKLQNHYRLGTVTYGNPLSNFSGSDKLSQVKGWLTFRHRVIGLCACVRELNCWYNCNTLRIIFASCRWSLSLQKIQCINIWNYYDRKKFDFINLTREITFQQWAVFYFCWWPNFYVQIIDVNDQIFIMINCRLCKLKSYFARIILEV